MTIAQQLYPFTDPDGTPIPLDVINFYGHIRQAFTASTPVNGISIPAAADFLVLFATEACLVALAATVVVPSDGDHTTGYIYVPRNTYLTIAHFGAADLSVVGEGIAGTLVVYTCKKWAGLRTLAQFNNT